MENLKNKVKAKSGKLANVIISIFIILPLCYLFYVNAEKAGATCAKADSLSLKNTPPDSAIIKLQAAFDIAKASPNEANFITLSLQYYNNAMYKECIAAAKKAIEYNPNSYPAYNNMCCSYNRLGMWDEAIVAGKKALEIAPGDQLATNNLYVSLDGMKKQYKSIADAEALVKDSANEANYLNLAHLYYQAGKFELSISMYKKVIEINKNSVIAYNNICSAYNELGKWKEAAENCEKALKIDSTFTLAKNNLKVAKDNLKK